MDAETQELINSLAELIHDKKGFNVVALDLTKFSPMLDGVIIAEGSVDRHVIAIGDHIVSEMKKRGEKPLYTEGLAHGDWVVIDFGTVSVHIFGPRLRELYRLEQLWSEGELIELNLEESQSNLG